MEEIYKELVGKWFIYQNRNQNEIYTFFKSLPIGVNLTVAIYKVSTRYEVRAGNEARTSSQYESVVGIADTLEDALKIAVRECEERLEDFNE